MPAPAKAAGEAPRRHRRIAHGLLPLVLALAALAYLPGLGGPALLDDQHVLGPLGAVADGRLAPGDYVLFRGEGAVVRPVSRASFLANWWLAGDDLRAFKALNLALHLACGTLLYLLVLRLARRDAHLAPSAPALALLVCAAWLLAPLLVSTVLYTVQRMAQLAALFTLAGLLAYAAGRERGRPAPVLFAFLVCWPLAVLSKENGAVLPLLALLVELWFFATAPEHRRWLRGLLVVVSIPAALLLARTLWDPAWITAGYQERDFSLAERLLTQPRVLFDYLGNLLVLPGASPPGLFRDDVAASRGLLAPATTAAALAGWAVLIVVAIRSRGSAWAGAGFGLLFFLAAHLPEASVFPLELYFEHRNYLPAAGALLGLGAAVVVAAGRHRALVALAAALAIGMTGLMTASRATIWSSESSLYAHATATHPRSARAWLGLAATRLAAGDRAAAGAAQARALALLGAGASFPLALQTLAADCLAGRAPEERTWARLAGAPGIPADLHTANALAWLAGALARGACPALDRARLAAILQGLDAEPGSGRAARLRDAHLLRLDELLGPESIRGRDPDAN